MPETLKKTEPVEVILFDLGGVLIELGGVPTMLSWTRLSEQEVWQTWLQSPAVRKFESGQSSGEDFAQELVSELALDVSAEEFLAHFVQWPKSVLPGGLELLDQLRTDYKVACLSNSNHLHWQRFEQETPLLSFFHSVLSSHQTGLLKPDPEAFEHTINVLEASPQSILFLDDNLINVDAARKAGLRAEVTQGVGQARQHLQDYGLIK